MSKRGAAALVAMAAIACVVWLQQPARRQPDILGVASDRQIVRWSPELVERLTVHGPQGQETIVRRQPGVWRVVAPVTVTADVAAVQDLLADLAGMRGRMAVPQPLVFATLVSVTAELHDGSVSPLVIGTVGSKHYVRERPQRIWQILHAPLRAVGASLRERSLLRFDANKVTEVTLAGPELSLRLRRSGQRWQLLQPLTDSADNTRVRELLAALGSLSTQRYIENPERLSAYGLDPPRARVSVATLDTTYSATLGGRGPKASTVYAQRGGESVVVVCSDTISNLVVWDVAYWRSRRLCTFGAEAVVALEVRSAPSGQVVRLERETQGYSFTLPRAFSADLHATQALLEQLTQVRIHRFVTDAPSDLSHFGLDLPLSLTVETAGARMELLIGRRVPSTRLYTAMRKGKNEVLWLEMPSMAVLESLDRLLRDRRLLSWAWESIDRTSWQRHDRSYAATRDGSRKWVGSAFGANPEAVLEVVASLELTALLAEDPTSGEQVWLALRVGAGSEEVAVSFGRASADGSCFVRVVLPDGELVYGLLAAHHVVMLDAVFTDSP